MKLQIKWKSRVHQAVAISVGLVVMAMSAYSPADKEQGMTIRVPAEWEPQEAIWLQWPGPYEKVFEDSFAEMTAVITKYQKLHILCDSQTIKKQAQAAISDVGVDPDHANIVWHIVSNDSAWMRDNGPVYVIADGRMRIQNWKFNAWGGAFGAHIPYTQDDAVPIRVADILDLPVDTIEIVHERGNLEFNGKDTVIANWSVLGDPDRNPGYTKEQVIADMKRHFGVSKVILIEGIPEADLTKGHVDGIARFINESTVVVSQCTSASKCKPGDGRDDAVYESAARTIQAAGFEVIRDPMQATVEFQGMTFDTNYVNWIVGNDFVLLVGFDNPETDSAAKARVESYFPGREVHVVEMLRSWASGGGAHCHTNDQPALSLARNQ
ncbi:MAG: agmatine deiminase family protein [Acidiferrobacterales bacterium]|nr:agmatine deiminase family protein [Acidiferrobacterales bacterium]